MKNFFYKATLLSTVLLVACGSAPTDTQGVMDDHHQGETTVMPHDHDEDGMPMDDVMDDHHQGEKNVQPHGHDNDVAPKPPSRGNTVEDHDDTGTEPHGH